MRDMLNQYFVQEKESMAIWQEDFLHVSRFIYAIHVGALHDIKDLKTMKDFRKRI
jgi:hypothetical protein